MESLCADRLCNDKFCLCSVCSTIEGTGGTEHILSECKTGFYFMGIAANKWVKRAQNFDEVMKRIFSSNGEVKFLLLDPDSIEAEKLSLESGREADFIKNKIIDNIECLVRLKKLGLNVEVKTYSHKPIFRIAIVDDSRKIYVGSYKPNCEGEDIPQIVMEKEGAASELESNLMQQFIDYFEVEWNNPLCKEIML